MSHRGRRVWNEICSQIARPGELESVRRRRSREEIIVGIVTEECGTTSNLAADDFASDIILQLWESKQFGEDFDAIREYVRGGIRKAIRKQEFAARRFIDCVVTNDGRRIPIERVERARSTRPMQELRIHAREAASLAMALPRRQRDCLFILADGGNPIDVANDLGVAPWDAIKLIKEARVNIQRVDPA